MPNEKCKHIKKKCKTCGWVAEKERQATCPQCGADLRCGNPPVPGWTRCRVHGGPNPARDFYGTGRMSTGERSSFPLVRLAAKYRQMAQDGNVLSNRQAINIIDERVMQLLGRINLEEAPERVSKLYNLWIEYKDARDDKRMEEAFAVSQKLDDEFEKVYHDYHAWKQMFEALDLRGKMVEREIKILGQIKALITIEQAYEMAAKMLGAAMKVIGDEPKKLKELQYEFIRITGERSDLTIEDGESDDWGAGGTVGSEEGPGDVDQEELLHPRDET